MSVFSKFSNLANLTKTNLGNLTKKDTSKILTTAFEKLSLSSDLVSITSIVAETARLLSGADGTTFVLRDKDLCYYVDENSISPLWKGQRFPMANCISGWSMIHQQPVMIPDIYEDNRIPHDAYRPTFVKSLCMIPIRIENPLGAIGNYWSQGYIPSEDEVKSLQVLANSTAIALENLELRMVLTNQNDYSKDLQSRNNELEIALNAMAHDLRTPVAGMTGLAELLRIRLGDHIDPESNDFLKAIMDTGRQTANQIEQMLSLYRATSGIISKQELDLSKITNELVNVLRPEYANRAVQFNIEPHLMAYADAPLVRIVMGNLLSNALKYSSKKPLSQIDVGLHKHDNQYNTFYVRDNGDGFDPGKANKLFQPMSRLHSQTEFAGTGLGLASVAKIVEVHGGRCHAEGKPFEGATFYFSLPRVSS
ncbi:MAG: GAF domain-containing sensor histidine kinase [Bdellovibrionaceae bacterium]|nr:GAF domain-containing sensor histidine kinase [Pseudobdellovibrionaceae bacterium]